MHDQDVRRARPILAAFALAIVFARCSTPPPADVYMDLEPEAKNAFVAYYPLLTPSQRQELLRRGGSEYIARDYALENGLNAGKGPVEIPRFLLNPASYTLVDLKISADPNSSLLTAGTSVPLRAELFYGDGRHTDVTSDVTWSAEPGVARVAGAELVYGCAVSDVVVGANFYRERDGSRLFRIRKPLTGLELRISGEWEDFDRGNLIGMQVIAHCEDGTSSDVSCQADWRADSRALRVDGCGSVRILDKEALSRGAVSLSARYGGLSVTRAFHLDDFKK